MITLTLLTATLISSSNQGWEPLLKGQFGPFLYEPTENEHAALFQFTGTRTYKDLEFKFDGVKRPCHVLTIKIIGGDADLPTGEREEISHGMQTLGILDTNTTYFGIVRVSKNDELKLFVSNAVLAVDEPSVSVKQALPLTSPAHFIRDENPHLSTLYTYITEALSRSDKEAQEILKAFHIRTSGGGAPYPYRNTLSTRVPTEQNKLTGPSLWIFNKAKTAPPIKKMMLLEVLSEWQIDGWQEEFLEAYQKEKDNPELASFINLRKINLEYQQFIDRISFKLTTDQALDYADQTSSPEAKSMFLLTIGQHAAAANHEQRVRMAKMLKVDDGYLQRSLIRRFSVMENQPDKQVDVSPGRTEQQIAAQTAALAVYWLTFYDIPPSN